LAAISVKEKNMEEKMMVTRILIRVLLIQPPKKEMRVSKTHIILITCLKIEKE
jgi:hypothetical protein